MVLLSLAPILNMCNILWEEGEALYFLPLHGNQIFQPEKNDQSNHISQ
jgi:hypothetical protein